MQVVKEGFGNKGPRLSTQIGLAGRYLVLLPMDNQTGISRRIEDDEERKRLRILFNELKLANKLGFIVRTAASGRSKQELLRDAQFLLKLWSRLEKIMQHKKAPSLIYEEYDLTEASPVVTLNPLKGKRKPGSIGISLSKNIELNIVDEM